MNPQPKPKRHKLKHRLARWLGRRLGEKTIRAMLAARTEARFAEIYGDFHYADDYGHLGVATPVNESKAVRGDVVYLMHAAKPGKGDILLAGEPVAVKPMYASLLGLNEAAIFTAGLNDGDDWCWNYEQAPPEDLAARPFDLVISQAILEHLLDPYRHIRDCASLLAPGGRLLVHTVMPGFMYHRHPIDCVRFYPDWFETVAQRLGLSIEAKIINDSHILYLYKKPA